MPEIFIMLIEQAEKASQRARWLLTICTIICITQLGAAYNYYVNPFRGLIESLIFSAATTTQNKYLSELHSAIIKSWIDQISVSVNIFGTKFPALDASFVGSIALAIAALWLFYGIRREHHIISQTIRLAEKQTQDIKSYVFFGLSSSQLFSTLRSGKIPEEKYSMTAPSIFGGSRFAITLIYMPVAAMGVMIASDIYSVFLTKAVFRGVDEYYYLYWMKKGTLLAELINVGIPLLIELALTLYIFTVCRQTSNIQQDTEQLLQGMESDGWANPAQ